MQTAYAVVRRDFADQGDFLVLEYDKLLRLETVPHGWPLARLSIPYKRMLITLTGYSLAVAGSIRLAAKRLTMLLAEYLAKEVAAILREILTHPTKKLYDDDTAHLLCSNYWLQPIYQELLHSSSQCNCEWWKEQAQQWIGSNISTS